MAQFPRVIPVGVLNETTGEIIPLKLSAAGALQVDLIELEDVRINLPEGTALDVAVQNTSPIPVSLPEGNVDVEVKNASAIPVSLPEGNVGVEVNNAAAIPVSLPEGNVSVEFPEAQDVNVTKLVPAGQTVQIASAASSSASLEVGGVEAFGVGVPYGTEGASLGLWVSIDGTSWFLLPEVLPFVADQAGINYACNTAGVGLIELLAPWAYCKLQTLDSEGNAQVQAADFELASFPCPSVK